MLASLGGLGGKLAFTGFIFFHLRRRHRWHRRRQSRHTAREFFMPAVRVLIWLGR